MATGPLKRRVHLYPAVTDDRIAKEIDGLLKETPVGVKQEVEVLGDSIKPLGAGATGGTITVRGSVGPGIGSPKVASPEEVRKRTQELISTGAGTIEIIEHGQKGASLGFRMEGGKIIINDSEKGEYTVEELGKATGLKGARILIEGRDRDFKREKK